MSKAEHEPEGGSGELVKDLVQLTDVCSRAVARIRELEVKLAEETAIVDRVWAAIGISTYEKAGGKAIDEIVSALRGKLAGSIAAEGAAHKIIAELREKLEAAEKRTEEARENEVFWRDKLQSAEAQAGRLREALEEILAMDDWQGEWLLDIPDEALRIARAALGEWIK